MSSRPGPVLRAKLAVARARIETAEKRDRALVRVGSALGRAARSAILRLHHDEHVVPLEAIEMGGCVIDVVADLQAYTGLSPEAVDALVRRRSDSFRVEWFLAPEHHRVDDWFYLASTTYLFGNAAHDPRPLLALVSEHVPPPARALDFGGGAGNLAVALAASGFSVDFVERSALQKDFVAFRAARNGLTERLQVLNQWEPLPRDAYDVVCAVDVLEHVEDLFPLLRDQLLPAVRAGGALLESSPFVRNLSNPMHHEHEGVEDALAGAGFTLEADVEGCRVWRRT